MTIAADRPTMIPRATRATEKKRDDELDAGVRFIIDGEVFEARVGDVTPQIARELRKEAGFSFMKLMDLLSDEPDIDVISAAVWVSRRIAGENIAFDDVAVGYAQILGDGFEVEATGAEEFDGSPEAQGGRS